MKISLEVSMYPLADDYIPAIESFLEGLNTHSVTVQTNTMSTQVFGEFDDVWNAVGSELKKCFESGQKFAISTKVINSDLDPASKPFGEKYI